jgi:DNA polymerase-3 subunit alpha
MTIEHGLEASVDFRKLYEADPKNRELIDMARKVEGMARHASTHAAGVVITGTRWIPMCRWQKTMRPSSPSSP